MTSELANDLDIPTTVTAMRRQVVRKVATVGALVGLMAGVTADIVETRRVEATAHAAALESVNHFRTPALLKEVETDGDRPHPEVNGFLSRTSFVVVRILDQKGTPVMEAWKSEMPHLQPAVASHLRFRARSGESDHNWITEADRRFLQILHPLEVAESRLGYFEGIYLVDPQMVGTWRTRVVYAFGTGIVAALVTAFALYPVMVTMTRRALALSGALLDANVSLLRALGSAIALRDAETDVHNYRVTLYAVRLAEVLRRPRDEIAELIVGAFLHDVGKIGIPDAILLKPGALTADEFAVMKQHVLVHQDLFGGNSWLGKAHCIVRHHHERFDGSGYPDGLRAEQIPINARIFAVVDVFDALTSSRPYKPAYPLAYAREVMTLGRGSHFDPEVLTAFMEQAEELFTAIGGASAEALISMLEGVLADYCGSRGGWAVS